MTTLFINIKELIQVRDKSVDKVSGKDMSVLPTIKNAFLLIEKSWFDRRVATGMGGSRWKYEV